MCAFSFRPQLAPAPAGAFVISDYTDKDVSPARAADHDRLCHVTLIHAPTRYTAYTAIIPISAIRASGRSVAKGIDGAPASDYGPKFESLLHLLCRTHSF